MFSIVVRLVYICFFKQKTAYEMRISDWSSDVCSSDLVRERSTMRHMAAVQPEDQNLPKGIQRSRPLPDAKLGALWDSIILDERLKSQLQIGRALCRERVCPYV